MEGIFFQKHLFMSAGRGANYLGQIYWGVLLHWGNNARFMPSGEWGKGVIRNVWGVIVWPEGQVNSLAKRFVIVVNIYRIWTSKEVGEKPQRMGGSFHGGRS